MRKRWFQRIFVATCLILICLVCAAWVRSYWYSGVIQLPAGSRASVILTSHHGSLWLNGINPNPRQPTIFVSVNKDRPMTPFQYQVVYSPYPPTPSSATAAFPTYFTLSTGGEWIWRAESWSMVFPHWALLVPLLAYPSIVMIRYFRRRSNAGGNCTNCGYDLRATPDRCPECGLTNKKIRPHVHTS